MIDGSFFIVCPNIRYIEDFLLLSMPAILASLLYFSFKCIKLFDAILDKLPALLSQRAQENFLEDLAIKQEIQYAKDFVAVRLPESRRWYLACMALFVLLVIIFQLIIPILYPQGTRSWAFMPKTYPASYLFATLWALFYWVSITSNVVWYALSIAVQISRLIKYLLINYKLDFFNIAIDFQACYSRIGSLSLNLIMASTPGLLIVVLWAFMFGIDAPFKIGLLIYVTIFPFFLMRPAWAIHKAAFLAKRFELSCFDTVVIRNGLQAAKSEYEYFVAMTHVLQMRRMLESFSTWPFNLGQIIRFVPVYFFPTYLYPILLELADIKAMF